jgi:hypothetical protein
MMQRSIAKEAGGGRGQKEEHQGREAGNTVMMETHIT